MDYIVLIGVNSFPNPFLVTKLVTKSVCNEGNSFVEKFHTASINTNISTTGLFPANFGDLSEFH
jgi:uncharacterized membrane protein (DUF485 family)